jgi:hypothetical protein
MCCVLSGPLSAAIAQIIRQAKPDRVIIEPSGLGHPGGEWAVADVCKYAMQCDSTLAQQQHRQGGKQAGYRCQCSSNVSGQLLVFYYSQVHFAAQYTGIAAALPGGTAGSTYTDASAAAM